VRAVHLEILVEEPSMEAFLRALLPRVLGELATFEVYPYQGKQDLLGKLDDRLRGYTAWLPRNWRIVVMLDRDDDDCIGLKQTVEQLATKARLRTRAAGSSPCWQVVNRIAIEKLEAWYFGDWDAVRAAYPRVNASIPQKAAFRNADSILGGTWEPFERVLQHAGYFTGGLRKTEVARELGQRVDPTRNTSVSFSAFYQAVTEAVSREETCGNRVD
jgi:hypothetical protein